MQTYILVAAQNPELRVLISRIFNEPLDTGEIQLVYPANNTEALEYLKKYSLTTIILSEVDSMQEDDSSLLPSIYTHYPALPVIVILSDDEIQRIRKIMNQGAFDFLIEPVRRDDLENTIKKAIRHTQQLHHNILRYTSLENQIKHLEQAIQTMRLGVTITDLEGHILYTNPADARMHDYESDELIGQDVRILAPPELRDPMTLEQIRQWRGAIRESVNIRKDGTRFPVWLMSDIIKNTEGEPAAIVTSCEDISERKYVEKELEKHRHRLEELIEERTQELRTMNEALRQEITEREYAEKALQESEREYRLLFENLPDVFYRIDREGKLLLTSPLITQFLGYSLEEAVGMNVATDLFVHPEQWEDFLMFMEADGHLDNFEILLKRQDGSYEWGSASARCYTDHEGQVLGFEGIIRDISIRKQAELELFVAHDELRKTNMQLQELNASKDKFFSIISHDLRNQFTTLLGFTELIESKVGIYSLQRLKDVISKLKNSADRLYALFENLLTWSRLQRGAMKCSPRRISLFTLVEENVLMMKPKAELKHITLKNTLRKDVEAYADHSMVDTIIRNLLSNALKFTNVKGRITISTELRNQDVEISISDTGCGIDEEALELLFRIDTTYTTKGTAGEHGTGLGLIICQELIEKNNGRIWGESEIGKGTTFVFTLPHSAS